MELFIVTEKITRKVFYYRKWYFKNGKDLQLC